jgi:hypothetical protein
MRLLARSGLEDRRDDHPYRLSCGQRAYLPAARSTPWSGSGAAPLPAVLYSRGVGA